jgi:enoyl-CoA hydratase
VTAPSTSSIVVTSDGPLRIITLNRPERLNAANENMHAALTAVWQDVARDPDARVAILTGSGRAFSAGGDLEWIRGLQTDAQARARTIREGREIICQMVRFPLPLIAAVNGPAVGLGVSLAISCDIVLMADSAWFADPHVTVGLVAADGGAELWPLLTSMLRAKEYLFTGDRISAAEAVQLGLANRVMSAADLMTEARSLALRLAGQPAQALQDTKRALNGHIERALVGILDAAFLAERESLVSDDHIERIAALLASSKPPAKTAPDGHRP